MYENPKIVYTVKTL